MVEARDKRPTIYLGDEEATWVSEQQKHHDESKSGVIRAAVRAAMDNPEILEAEL